MNFLDIFIYFYIKNINTIINTNKVLFSVLFKIKLTQKINYLKMKVCKSI